MRNTFAYLGFLVVMALLVVVLLPMLGVLLLVLAGVVVLGIALLWAAPLLAKLPWFRNRIRVYRSGTFQSVQFGRDEQPPQEPEREEPPQLDDVIDVQGRELPDEEDGKG